MATAAERRALLFLLTVVLVGAGVRARSSRRFERDVAAGLRTADSSSASVDRQLSAVDSARRSWPSRPGRRPTRVVPPRGVPTPTPATRSRSRNPQPTLSRGEQRAPIGPVDVNSATVEELEQLPRIGPSLARRIVAHREEHGAYRSIDDLRLVRGIGVTTAALVAPLVTFSGGFRPIPE